MDAFLIALDGTTARGAGYARLRPVYLGEELSVFPPAYNWLKRDAAPGVDAMTRDAYGEGLEGRLRDLESRIHLGSYRAQPSLRAYIPKPDGRQRPLGIAALEDKIVQRAVVEVLNAIYEQDFVGFSYGFDPAGDSTTRLTQSQRVSGQVALFDNISHDWMMRFVELPIGDRRVLRLIRGWLKAGVVEGRETATGDAGHPPGGYRLALLANIHLHYVCDLWAEQWRRCHARGAMVAVRYADDSVIGFEHPSDAESFLAQLRIRMAAFALDLHPEKTRLIEFGGRAARGRAASSSPGIQGATGSRRSFWRSRRTFDGDGTKA
jgi:group II intron reverse transcriptase/maturase